MATPKPMCAVTIGYETYVMPATAGMKVVELMQQALACECDYGIGDTITATGPVNVTYRSMRSDQITMPPAPRSSPPAARPARKPSPSNPSD